MCLALGYTHPDELLDAMTAEQMDEWEAFNRIQPIGGQRLDFYFAYLMTSIHNLAISIHAKKGTKHFELEDFLPNWAGVEKEQQVMSNDEMKAFWTAFAEQHNRTAKKKERKKE